MRFDGFRNETAINAAAEKLRSWIEQQGWKVNGKTKVAYYDPPWTPALLRRNEVVIPPRETASCTFLFPFIPHAVGVTQRLLTLLLLSCNCPCGSGQAIASDAEAERPASEYRKFTDKRGQQVDARIVTVSDDLSVLNLEGKDGRTFELPITALSLDDQQFLREWLYPSTAKSAGEVKVFGFLPGEKSIDADALAGIDDIVSIHAGKHAWFALRESGEVMTFEDRFAGLSDVVHLDVNTVWYNFTRSNGTVGGSKGGLYSPDVLTEAARCASGNGHAAVLLRDGTIKVWGRLYGNKQPIDPSKPLSGIVGLASTQSRMAAIDKEGRLYSWNAGKPEVFEAMLGDGVVEIDGSIFDCLALTESGEVYTWNRADVTKARIPDVLKGEGPFQKIRCNGATRAAQKADGSWIAWGRNSSGIVDHINSLGPVSDLDFFSEPGKQGMGYVIWREAGVAGRKLGQAGAPLLYRPGAADAPATRNTTSSRGRFTASSTPRSK